MSPELPHKEDWRRQVRAFRLAAEALRDPMRGLLGDLLAPESLYGLGAGLPMGDVSPFGTLPEAPVEQREVAAGEARPTREWPASQGRPSRAPDPAPLLSAAMSGQRAAPPTVGPPPGEPAADAQPVFSLRQPAPQKGAARTPQVLRPASRNLAAAEAARSAGTQAGPDTASRDAAVALGHVLASELAGSSGSDERRRPSQESSSLLATLVESVLGEVVARDQGAGPGRGRAASPGASNQRTRDAESLGARRGEAASELRAARTERSVAGETRDATASPARAGNAQRSVGDAIGRVAATVAGAGAPMTTPVSSQIAETLAVIGDLAGRVIAEGLTQGNGRSSPGGTVADAIEGALAPETLPPATARQRREVGPASSPRSGLDDILHGGAGPGAPAPERGRTGGRQDEAPGSERELDGEMLASLVNDALLEDARRHGVDLS